MSRIIECPICEQQFVLDVRADPNAPIDCRSCGRSFALAVADRIPKAGGEPEQLTARPIIPRGGPLPSADFRRGGDLPDPAAAENQNSSPPELRDTSAIKASLLAKQRRRTVKLLILALIVLALGGGLAYGLGLQLAKSTADSSSGTTDEKGTDPQAGKRRGENAVEIQPTLDGEPAIGDGSGSLEGQRETEQRETNQRETTDLAVTGAGSTNRAETKVAQRENIPDTFPPHRPFFLAKKSIADCRRTVSPYLVELRVFAGEQPHRATATIVDSRGWVLTSYSAVAGATKIEVTTPIQSLPELRKRRQRPVDDRLTDLVRGVVLADPQNDWIVLSINRRFVVSIADLAIADRDRLVDGKPLVKCAPVTVENPHAASEVRIEGRIAREDLPNQWRQQARRQKISQSAQWLSVSSQYVTPPGTPIFLPDGTLVAIQVFDSLPGAEGEPANRTQPTNRYPCLAIPIANVKSQLASVRDEIQPLSSLGGQQPQVAPEPTQAPNRLQESLTAARQIHQQCEAFDWITKDPEEYALLQQFGRAYATLSKSAAAADLEQGKPVADQLVDWRLKLSERFSSLGLLETKQLRDLNSRLAAPLLDQSSELVVCLAVVNRADFNGTITMSLVGQRASVTMPYDPTKQVMRPGEEWLLFLQTPNVPQQLESNGTQTQVVSSVLAIGPIQ